MSRHITEAPTEQIEPRWAGRTIVVAATGPSLTPDVAEALRGELVVAVSDAWRLIPWAAVMYSCDAAWWRLHEGARGFAGERWSSHGGNASNDKAAIGREFGVRLVAGKPGDTFSADPEHIHFGSNSGFQAINFAILAGACRCRIVLVGFDMRVRNGQRHFFGDHPRPLSNRIDYRTFVPTFKKAAQHLPAGVEIVNATTHSALECFPKLPLDAALVTRETVTA